MSRGKLLIASLLSLFSMTAFADHGMGSGPRGGIGVVVGRINLLSSSRELLVQKAELLSNILKYNAENLREIDANDIERSLDEAIRVGQMVSGGRPGMPPRPRPPGMPGGGGGGYPLPPSHPGYPPMPPSYPTPPGGGYYPPVPAPVYGNACIVHGAGNYAGYYRQFRIEVAGQTMDATDRLDDLISKLNLLEANRICSNRGDKIITVIGAGNYAGYYKGFRLAVDGEVIIASDSLDEILDIQRKLTEARVGRAMASQVCNLLGAGNHAGYYRSYRVAIGSDVILGVDDLGTALSRMAQLRNVGLCN